MTATGHGDRRRPGRDGARGRHHGIGEALRRHFLRLFRMRGCPLGHKQRRRFIQHIQIFADGHETLATPGPQFGNDARQIVHRPLERIVEKKDAAQLAGTVHMAERIGQQGIVDGQAFPVVAVLRPEHDGKAHLIGQSQRILIICAVGRTDVTGTRAQFPQKRVRPGQFLELLLLVQGPQLGVRPGMVADLMPFGHDALDKRGAQGGIFAEQKERGMDAIAGQHVQQAARVAGRAVVKGDGAEVFPHLLPADARAVIDDRSPAGDAAQWRPCRQTQQHYQTSPAHTPQPLSSAFLRLLPPRRGCIYHRPESAASKAAANA